MAAGKEYDHVSACLEYPRGGRSEMDRDPEGKSRGYDMTSLQTVPCHIAGMLALSCWKKKNCFQQSDKFAGHVGEGLHLHSLDIEVTTELLCILNIPYTKLRVAFLF